MATKKNQNKFKPTNRFQYSLPTKKYCHFCIEKIDHIDYKNTKLLSKYLSRYMKIESAKRNGNCSKHQRQLAKALKRSRHMALLPFVLN